MHAYKKSKTFLSQIPNLNPTIIHNSQNLVTPKSLMRIGKQTMVYAYSGTVLFGLKEETWHMTVIPSLWETKAGDHNFKPSLGDSAKP